MNRRAFLLVLLLSSVVPPLLMGCGGGGSGEEPKNLYTLSSQTRTLQIGDTWQYDRQVTSATGKVYTSERTLSITQLPFGGVPTLTRVVQEDSQFGTGYIVDYFLQNDAGDVVLLGQRGKEGQGNEPASSLRDEIPYAEAQPVLFGRWTSGALLHYRLRYMGASEAFPTQAQTLEVVGTERVKTRLGTFDTWKVQVTPDDAPTQTTQTGTYWYAPQLGTFVRAEYVTSGWEIRDRVTMTMTATNIPLTPATPPP